MLHGTHQRNAVTGVSPRVDGIQFRRTAQNDERAAAGLQVRSQLFYGRGELNWIGFQAEHSESRGLENDAPINFSRSAQCLQKFKRLRDVRWKQADFGEQCAIGWRVPQVLPRIPDISRRFLYAG